MYQEQLNDEVLDAIYAEALDESENWLETIDWPDESMLADLDLPELEEEPLELANYTYYESIAGLPF